MPSRKSRSRSRSRSKRHKKSHKRSRKSNHESSSSKSSISIKKDEMNNENGSSSFYNLGPSSTLDSKEEETPAAPTGNQSSADSTTSITQTTTKRHKTRWMGDETEKVVLPNMPTTISANNMTEEQQKIYLSQLQIGELTRCLKMNDFGISSIPENRSPSPEPIYDQQGKRQNTREVRARRKIEDRRHQLITEILLLNPDYKAPSDYRPHQIKFNDKVIIPQEDYPDVSFVGLIIGPRGSTLKMLEKETNAKIIIRGIGSVKDGKMGLVKHGPLPGEGEPLHVYISGTTSEIVAKAVEKVQEIISQSIDAPEGLNDLRKQQLRQLALLNGTLRENDCLIKLKLINEAEKIITNTIICTICGGAGHVQSDCKFRKSPAGTFLTNGNRQEQQKFDCEYQSLINELSGKKETETNHLSLTDRRNLMSGLKTSGPTLAITNGSSPSSITDSKRSVRTVGSLSFNSNGSINANNDYNPPSLMSLNTNNGTNQSIYSNQQQASSGYPGTSFSASAPHYNNNDLFDGYHLLRRPNRTNNYSSYIEGDSYRAQHIPALEENGGYYNYNNSSTSWANSQQQQQQQQRNQINPSIYYQNAFQQQYYQNNSTGFIPPLPRAQAPPPPPPPPPPR